MFVIVIILLLAMMLAGMPRWELHSYSYGPSGLAGLLLVVLLVLALMGRL